MPGLDLRASSTMWARFQLLLVTTVFLKSDAQMQSKIAPFNASQIGVIDLPNIDPSAIPDFCRNFDDICRDEHAFDYESAFTAYESRYERCGDYGWNMTGRNRGYDAAVAFKTTPCGLQTAIKSSRREKSIVNIARDCHRLKVMNRPPFSTECPGCFPKFIFYSNYTKVCYSEFIKSEKDINTNILSKIPQAKSLYLQAMHIIQVLRRHNLQHGDLHFSNIFVRKLHPAGTPSSKRQYKLLFFDLSAMRRLDDVGDGRVTGNRGFGDTYTMTCNFYRNMYMDGTCRSQVPPVYTANKNSMRYALSQILSWVADPAVAPDFEAIATLIHSVVERA